MSNLFLKLIGILLLIGSFAGVWVYMDISSVAETPLNIPADMNGSGDAQPLSYTVVSGATLRDVARDLGGRGLLNRPTYLVWWALFQSKTQNKPYIIKVGEYALTPGMTAGQLLDKMAAGKVVQYSLTLVEGWTFKQMMAAINAHPVITHTLSGLTSSQIMARLGWPDQHPEGRFYPDTYSFSRGFSDVAFLQRAYRMMEQRLASEWPQRDSAVPYKTPYEALIMASIVERETGAAAERAQIAGVFVRRLNIGMALATDPTVIYGVGDSFDGNLRKRDLQTDTPYNTYLRRGLPPTPIAMPGGDAIHAALHPAPGKTLYFVARGNGTHYFSETLQEHNNAVRKYQLGGS